MHVSSQPDGLVLLCSEVGAVLYDGPATQEVIIKEPFSTSGATR
jgi:hypothetical protein